MAKVIEEKKGVYKNFRGMAHMRVDAHPVVQDDNRSIPLDGLMTAIFAPDPATGMPRSDLHIQLQGSLDLNTQEYIRRTLMRPLPESSAALKGSDPDAVLAAARKYNEGIDAYVQRLADMVSKHE